MSTGVDFPKSARLLKRREFQFRPFRRFRTPLFTFVYSTSGQGRLGISLSKKVLRRAVARNRVKRLLRESFRHKRLILTECDIHVLGAGALGERWHLLKRKDIDKEFDGLVASLR